jgi:hypothetical protein
LAITIVVAVRRRKLLAELRREIEDLAGSPDALLHASEQLWQIRARLGRAHVSTDEGQLQGHGVDRVAQFVHERADDQTERPLSIPTRELPELLAS